MWNELGKLWIQLTVSHILKNNKLNDKTVLETMRKYIKRQPNFWVSKGERIFDMCTETDSTDRWSWVWQPKYFKDSFFFFSSASKLSFHASGEMSLQVCEPRWKNEVCLLKIQAKFSSFPILHVGLCPLMKVYQPNVKNFLVTCIHIIRKKLSAYSSGIGSYDYGFLRQRHFFFFFVP